MSEYQKVFIGSGKKIKDYDMVEVVVEYAKLKPFEYNGVMYAKFTVAGNKNGANEYGKTHNVSMSERIDENNNMNDVQNPATQAAAPAVPEYPEEDINPEDIPF